jgi:uncharacterized repeat protein (TIGR03803 family)
MAQKKATWRTTLPTMLIVIAALCSAASAEWKEKVLYSFQGPPDGMTPTGALAFDKQGNVYGVTTLGGEGPCAPTQCGTVFQLKPTDNTGGAWTENVLHIFKGRQHGDGNTPAGGVIFDAAGNLYGTTAYGGTGNCVVLGTKTGCGTVFKMRPPATEGGKWTEEVRCSFKSGTDGYLPNGDLVFDNAGNLHGATEFGGGFGSCDAPYYQYCGTIFELSPPNTKGGKWTEKVLYRFKSGTDGANPNGGLIFDSRGDIYGTTSSGGDQVCKGDTYVGCGTAYELTFPPSKGGSWREKLIHSFVNYAQDGAAPNGGLVLDTKGHLYGTTSGGGGAENGVVFRLAELSGAWTESVVHTFQGTEGWDPMAGMIFDSLGSLYATTSGGTANGAGSVFKLSPATGGSWALSVLHSFKGRSDGSYPASKLVFDSGGNLYSTTQQSGNSGGSCGNDGCGTVFRVRR